MMRQKSSLIIGVDEAGRGPLAGPLTIAVFVAPAKMRAKLIKVLGGKIKDSKKFSEKRREEIYKEFKRLRKSASTQGRGGKIHFFVSHVSNQIIDKRGISYATALGIKKSFSKLHHKNLMEEGNPLLLKKCGVIRLDGLLKAPEKYRSAGWRTKTIIGGDGKDIFIACASIVAKVRRDRLMRRLAKKYLKYYLEVHKGYGTKLHYKTIKKYGTSEIHRTSFCKNVKIV